MKVEYVRSSYGIGYELVIPISEFKKAAKSRTEFDILDYIIFSFTRTQDTDFEFSEVQYDAICKLLPKSGNIIFAIKESETRRYNPPRWCEIYSISNNVSKTILFSDNDGRNLYLNTSEDDDE